MSTTAPEPVHEWSDLDFRRAELTRTPPPDLALAAPPWRRAVICKWLGAAGASRCCTDGRVTLPELPACPAARALRFAVREIEEGALAVNNDWLVVLAAYLAAWLVLALFVAGPHP